MSQPGSGKAKLNLKEDVGQEIQKWDSCTLIINWNVILPMQRNSGDQPHLKKKREVKEPPHPPGQREHHKRKRQNQSLPAKIFTKTLKHKHQTI